MIPCIRPSIRHLCDDQTTLFKSKRNFYHMSIIHVIGMEMQWINNVKKKTLTEMFENTVPNSKKSMRGSK